MTTVISSCSTSFVIFAAVLFGVTGITAQGAVLANQVITYDAPQGVKASEDYAVTVSGHPFFVYTTATLHKDDLASFASFDFAGSVNVTIDSTREIKSAKILPASYGITPTINGNKIQFALSQPRNLTVEINGSSVRALHLFANPLETNRPRADDPSVLYFGPGIHDVGTLQLRDGMTLYIAGGAILRGIIPPNEQPVDPRDWAGQTVYSDFLRASQVTNVKICGRGIIDLSNLPWHSRKTIQMTGVSNVTIEGITIVGAPCWSVALFQAKNVHVRNIKEICALENSDGIDICNSQDVTVDDCFLRNNDDEVCVKTISPPPAQISKNIVVQNCVIWNERARGLGITNETRQNIDNVLFRNCDIIHDFSTSGDCAALAVIVSDSGTVSNIHFEDIRLEDVKANLLLCCIVKDIWGHDPERGHVKDVTFKNITVGGDSFLKSVIAGYDDTHLIENVTFDHFAILGQVIGSAHDGKFSTNSFVRNLQFSTDSPDTAPKPSSSQ